MNILLVDDEPKNIKLLEALLLPLGYKALTVSSGEGALKIIDSERIDLVLLDVMMPGINGYEVCKKIKNDDKTKFIPVVMVTSLIEREERIISIEAGADDFLSKPVDKTELIARVRSLLKMKSLHDELEESYKKLKELQKLKDDLSGMISHDINNFLICIRGNLDLVASEEGNLSDDVKKSLDVAIESGDDLAALVSDFMDITRMEENKLIPRLEDADINALIYGAAEKMGPVAKNAGVALKELDANKTLYCKIDTKLISRTVINLLVNAIKFTPPGGEVSIRGDIDGGNLKVSVKDTGPGIPPEYREKIFEKFSQIETKKANLKKGKGLGLTFCKLAVEAHGGKIWVESEGENKGSTFIFTVPKR